MVVTSKSEADQWDRVLDAAAELAALIDNSGIEIDEYDLEELTIFLTANGWVMHDLFKSLKRVWPPD